jgi:uroporphyrinogen decarboxylase
MKCRERSMAAINFSGPDRIPVMHQFLPAALYQHGDRLRRLWAKYPQDFGDFSREPIPVPDVKHFDDKGNYRAIELDEWGVWWEKCIFGILGHPFKRPLDDLMQLRSFKSPMPKMIGGPSFEKELQAANLHREHYYLRQGWISIFEVMHAVRRFEDVLMDIYNDSAEINLLADIITDYMAEMVRYYLAIDVDGIQFGDDFGTQTSLLIDTKTWKRFFMPRYERLMRPIRQANKHIFFHSCGYTVELMEAWAQLGVNVIWPQLNANPVGDLARLSHDFKMCVMLHPDRQELLPHGKPAQIERAIAELVNLFGNGNGGVILYGEIDNDFPFENIEALYRTFEKYRDRR